MVRGRAGCLQSVALRSVRPMPSRFGPRPTTPRRCPRTPARSGDRSAAGVDRKHGSCAHARDGPRRRAGSGHEAALHPSGRWSAAKSRASATSGWTGRLSVTSRQSAIPRSRSGDGLEAPVRLRDGWRVVEPSLERDGGVAWVGGAHHARVGGGGLGGGICRCASRHEVGISHVRAKHDAAGHLAVLGGHLAALDWNRAEHPGRVGESLGQALAAEQVGGGLEVRLSWTTAPSSTGPSWITRQAQGPSVSGRTSSSRAWLAGRSGAGS